MIEDSGHLNVSFDPHPLRGDILAILYQSAYNIFERPGSFCDDISSVGYL
jgi:hypothetical protein